MRTAQKMVSCFNLVSRANFCLSLGLAAKLPTTNQTKKMQWRVVAILAVMIAAFDCGPIAGPSDLSRALGSVLEEETTMGIQIVDLLISLL